MKKKNYFGYDLKLGRPSLYQNRILHLLYINKGVFLKEFGNIFYMPKRGVLNVLRSIRKHRKVNIKWFVHRSSSIRCKYRVPQFIVVYEKGKELEAVKLMFTKYPQIVGQSNYIRNYVTPILKVKHREDKRLKKWLFYLTGRRIRRREH